MPTIIPRSAWHARAPKNHISTTWAHRTEFVVHHSEGPTTQAVRAIQDFHMDTRGWADIGYNFLVDDAGRIYEGRGWLVIGAQATGHNTSGIGVCYIGMNSPTDAAKHSIRAMYDEANHLAGRTLAKHGHGQLSQNNTSCPGSSLLAWVKAGMTSPGGQPAPTTPHAEPWPGRLLRQPPIMTGTDVRSWQARMQQRGWSMTVDSAYGPQCEKVCRAFQESHGLAVDGVVGKLTWDEAFS